MKISYRNLPEESIERLHKIVRFGDTETYVISQAKQTIAQAAVAVGILTIALVTYATEAMRWSTPERIFYRIVLSVALPAVVLGAIYLASWARCRLKPCVIITPRYVLRTHPTWVEVLETRDLRGAHSWRVWETYIVQVESA